MLSFLEETLSSILKKHSNLSNYTIILPSKRAGGFLLHYLKKQNLTTNFAPNIISIEEFIEEISGLSILNSTELLFKSYEAYLNTPSKQEKDNFDTYSTWSTTLLNDFNEIDRYLIPSKDFFNYLNSIQDINHWYIQPEKTQLIENYLAFWDSLYSFYNNLKSFLAKENKGYQGMVYREAAENIEHYITHKKDTPHLFIGFNALNNAEQTIIQELLEDGNTEIYWDTDSYFYKDKNHGASYFIRKYLKEWSYYKSKDPINFNSNYNLSKEITIVEAQKNITQVKYIGQSLSKLTPEELNKTAVVLADENLLIPLLHSLPSNISKINITMGLTLKVFPVVSFFQNLFHLQINYKHNYYYKDVLSILNHPIGQLLFSNAKKIVEEITNKNLTHISFSKIEEIFSTEITNNVLWIFKNWGNNTETAISSCLDILLYLKKNDRTSKFDRVAYYNLYLIFKNIESLNQKYLFVQNTKTIQQLFIEMVSSTKIDFKGDAYQGLQIMGVLETRVLDFKNLFISSVNEGTLPSGKSNASFITHDLKFQYRLPSYVEKDAIYTYHFYRLLQRAENITILYNNFSDGLNTGEKSRFISQVEFDNLENHNITKEVVSPKISIYNPELKTLDKTEEVLKKLIFLANKGFSPSSLFSYVRNPLDFYYQKILNLKEFKEVEETVAANTMGTIIHDTLEAFYKPLEGSYLTKEILLKIEKNIEVEVNKQFKKYFKDGVFTKGKNLMIYEVSKRFIQNFIRKEISDLQKGNQIKILNIESKLKIELKIEDLNFPVFLKGTVDRVDEYNNELRILDYKTGLVKKSDLNIVDWNTITTDYKYSKVFQVLAYSYMYHSEQPFEKAQAGIISFKNLKEGFLDFGIKKSSQARTRNTIVSLDVLKEFETQLKNLILEIFNLEHPFTEKII